MNFQKITNSQFPVFNTVIMSQKQLVHGVYLNNNNNKKKTGNIYLVDCKRIFIFSTTLPLT